VWALSVEIVGMVLIFCCCWNRQSRIRIRCKERLQFTLIGIHRLFHVLILFQNALQSHHQGEYHHLYLHLLHHDMKVVLKHGILASSGVDLLVLLDLNQF
jgi:hypothetical protein